jgi:hypothetical protein
MRQSEQFSLEWNQVSLSRKRIRLERTKNKSDRDIPLNKTCQKVLEASHATRPDSGRVFLSRYGRDLNHPRAWFELALEEARVKNFRRHDLRHTFISRLIMKDVNLRTVQELAGHKTISMTTRYAHLAPEHNQAAIEKLTRWLPELASESPTTVGGEAGYVIMAFTPRLKALGHCFRVHRSALARSPTWGTTARTESGWSSLAKRRTALAGIRILPPTRRVGRRPVVMR